MDNEKILTEKDSLKIITGMIAQAKGGYYHDSGIGSILWGSVVSISGFMTFCTLYFKWDIDFDWWLITLFALVPQIFISRREQLDKVVKTHVGRALDIVWILYGISIFAIIFYMNVAPVLFMKFFRENGFELLQKNLETGEITSFLLTVPPSPGSLLLLLFAFPTLVTGYVQQFKPMIAGALLTYLFFVVSIYTRNPVDQLLMGFSGLFNWLIPGVMLRKKYLASRR